MSETTAIDLFCGCGGLTEGLKQAGVKVLGALDNDPKACRVYRSNHPEVQLSECDISQLSPSEFRKQLGVAKGSLTLLAGCPPCQGFSRLRTRNRRSRSRDRRNALIEHFGEFVNEFLPKHLMLENVPGLSSHYRFGRLLKLLASLGYEHEHRIMNVADYGVPQRRTRLILLASRSGPPRFAPKVNKITTVREAISALESPDKSLDLLHAMPERRSQKVKNLIKKIPHDGGSRKDLPPEFRLECHQRMSGFGDVYGRMRWDDLSPTITSGCHNPSKGRFIHPEQDRAISLREASILQGFPTNYRFDVSTGKEALALMIGNALPPPFIKSHARSLLGFAHITEDDVSDG